MKTHPVIVSRKVDDLIPYARNSRTHSDAQVAQIAASIAEFGFTAPILAGSDGVIVAGHGRLAASRPRWRPQARRSQRSRLIVCWR